MISTSNSEPVRTGPTGPRTSTGKAISSLNNLQHGLTGAFRVLTAQSESQSDFDAAHEALISEHQPTTPTESELVRRMAEHAWLSRRAQNLQDKAVMDCNGPLLALFLRYQTTNDRGFRSCLNELFRLRRERRAALRSADSQKEFESQSPESKNREAEFHAARVCLANARAAHLEMDTELRSQIDAPIPGYSSVPVEQIKELFQVAMMRLQHETEVKTAA